MMFLYGCQAPCHASVKSGPGLQNGFIAPAENSKFGTKGVSNSTLLHEPLDIFSPRVGFAYDVLGNGKMAIRGGYGLYYQRMGCMSSLQSVSNPPFNLAASDFYSPQIYGIPWQAQILTNPFPTLPLPSAFPIFPQMPTLQSLNPLGGPNYDVNPLTGITEIDPRNGTPSTEQWNLTIETELIKNWALEIGYVGSHAIHQVMSQATNSALLRNANNPGPFGLDVNSPANALSRVPIIGVEGLSDITTDGKSLYDALLVTVSHRFSKGLYMKAAYTWSKALDNYPSVNGFEPGLGEPGNQYIPDLNYGLSSYNTPYRFVASYVYDLPGPKHGVASYFIGNWSLSGETTLQSGTSGYIGQPAYSSLTGSAGYGIVLPGCTLKSSGSVSDHVSNYLNASCVTTQPLLAPGTTFGPLSPIAGPGDQMYTIDPASSGGNLMGSSTRGAFQNPFQTRWDMALKKTFPVHVLGERGDLQFIAQAFNLFNTPIFGPPGSTAGYPNFGMIGSTLTGGRELQFALRVNF